MDKLFSGVKEFSENEFETYKHLFEELQHKQNPHTLFIGCSDSRVVPDLITKTMPGELFVVRNVANLVPHYRMSTEYLATTAAIEFAIKILKVENIVVCGHSNCGGCKALFASEEELSMIPYTKKWLELAKAVKEKAELMMEKFHESHIEWFVEQENIVEQMNHLMSYPFIEEKYKSGELKIFGWYYEIGKGLVFNYNKETMVFEKI